MKLIVTIALAGLAATMTYGFAPVQTEKVDQARALAVQATAVNLRSVYQLTGTTTGGVGGRRIHIEGNLGGEGTLYPNPNACSLNEFGVPVICTQIAVAKQRFTFHEVKIQDPTGQGRRLFELRGLEATTSIFLVVPKDASGSYRLIQKSRTGQFVGLVSLERSSS